MEEKLQKYIDDLNFWVWEFNKYHNERKPDTSIYKTTLSTAKIIKSNCQLIVDNPKDTEILNRGIEYIEQLCYGDALRCKSRLRDRPVDICKHIIKECDKIINLLNSEGDSDIKMLNDKYRHKWLYFDNVEAPSFIIWIDRISYKGEEIVWTGNQIVLNTCNSTANWGVNCEYVEEETFDCLGGYYNGYDDAGTEIESIDRYLSYNVKDGNNGDGRVCSNEEVKSMIMNQLYWAFEMTTENGINWSNIFENFKPEHLNF